MPDVEKVSVRVHLRAHGWGGRLVKTPDGKKKGGKKIKWSSSSINQAKFFFFFFFS